MRNGVRALAAALVAATIVSSGAAEAQDPAVLRAIDDQDFDALVVYSGRDDDEARLGAAIVEAMLGKDDQASAKLESIAALSDRPDLQARALLTLSGIRVRQGRYGDAAELMTRIERMPAVEGVNINAQTRDFFLALSSVPAMRASIPPSSEVSVTRDRVGLPRIPFSVNGRTDAAVFDTGAAYSTVTASTAARLGLRMLGADADVTGATGATTRSGLAIADRLELGGAVFLHVPFIVVPDETLTFAEADYSISSIIGFPVIAQLGRLAFSRKDEGETLDFAPSTTPPDAARANLVYSGWQPMVLLRAGDGDRRLRLFLDTGSNTSHLNASALELSSFGERRAGSLRSHGAGRSETRTTDVVEAATFWIGDTPVRVESMNILPDDGSGRHGQLGQDVLARSSTLVLDFGAMTIAVG